jgi:type VI protein secretion system component Hcp
MDSTTKIYLEMTLEDGTSGLGEAEAAGYTSRIDIDSFQFGVSAKRQNVKDEKKKDVSGNLQFDLFSFSKVFDRATLELAKVLKSHKRFKQVLVAVDQQLVDKSVNSSGRNEILFITLEKGYVADIKMRTSDGGKSGVSIKDDITLSFKNCSISYYAYAGSRDNKGEELGNDYRLDNTHIFEYVETAQGE